jgi:hypothetical protein
MLDWFPLVLGGGVIVVGLFFLFRSLRRWRTPPATSPDAKQGEARLWSTMNMDQC